MSIKSMPRPFVIPQSRGPLADARGSESSQIGWASVPSRDRQGAVELSGPETEGLRPSELLIFRGARLRVDRRSLRRFAQRLYEEVAGGRAFCCLVTNDREMRRLNREFLGKDYATDVLSFPETGSDGSLGEIAISIGRAARQAQEYAHGTEEEICLLMLHGILHLMGLDHENDRGRMKRAEARWRHRLALPAGLISRVPA